MGRLHRTQRKHTANTAMNLRRKIYTGVIVGKASCFGIAESADELTTHTVGKNQSGERHSTTAKGLTMSKQQCGTCKWFKTHSMEQNSIWREHYRNNPMGHCQFFMKTLSSYKRKKTLPMWASSSFHSANLGNKCGVWEPRP